MRLIYKRINKRLNILFKFIKNNQNIVKIKKIGENIIKIKKNIYEI